MPNNPDVIVAATGSAKIETLRIMPARISLADWRKFSAENPTVILGTAIPEGCEIQVRPVVVGKRG